jgi:hypothetical protein
MPEPVSAPAALPAPAPLATPALTSFRRRARLLLQAAWIMGLLAASAFASAAPGHIDVR